MEASSSKQQSTDPGHWHDGYARDLASTDEAIAPARLYGWIIGLLPQIGGAAQDFSTDAGRVHAWSACRGFYIVAVYPDGNAETHDNTERTIERAVGRRAHAGPALRSDPPIMESSCRVCASLSRRQRQPQLNEAFPRKLYNNCRPSLWIFRNNYRAPGLHCRHQLHRPEANGREICAIAVVNSLGESR